MTFEEEVKILGEINKEIIKKGRLLYSYEFRGILDKFIVKSDEKIVESDSSEEVIKLRNPNGDLISREALKEDFKSRLAACNDWIEKAKDKETKIRARAIKTFIAEVIMTIDNAPTTERIPQGEWIYHDKLNMYYCKDCGLFEPFTKEEIEEEGCKLPNFCQQCGAQMKGVENEKVSM